MFPTVMGGDFFPVYSREGGGALFFGLSILPMVYFPAQKFIKF